MNNNIKKYKKSRLNSTRERRHDYDKYEKLSIH